MGQPNILITGTPGVGKSKLSSKISDIYKFKWHDISAIAKEHGFIENNDEEEDCPILDEDPLLDYLEPIMSEGGNIVEYHGCNFFPERWFHVVLVVRCDNKILFDRLTARGYSSKKVGENVECEIFQITLDEARSSYAEEIVHEIFGETESQFKENVDRISKWVDKWRVDNNT